MSIHKGLQTTVWNIIQLYKERGGVFMNMESYTYIHAPKNKNYEHFYRYKYVHKGLPRWH